MNIGEVLNELLTGDKTAIRVPVSFGPEGFFDINKSVVLSWIVILVFLLLCLFLTSNLKTEGCGRRQMIAELAVTKLRGLVQGLLGHHGSRYTDFLLTIMLFLGLSDLMGLFGVVPPTMDLNVTIAFALVAISLVEWASLRARGVGGFFKSFAKPIAIITPMNILELAIKPLSLCMRLFGNILGATVIMELLKLVVPVGLPAVFSLYFDFFDGLIQAYVFVFLTSLYIAEATE